MQEVGKPRRFDGHRLRLRRQGENCLVVERPVVVFPDGNCQQFCEVHYGRMNASTKSQSCYFHCTHEFLRMNTKGGSVIRSAHGERANFARLVLGCTTRLTSNVLVQTSSLHNFLVQADSFGHHVKCNRRKHLLNQVPFFEKNTAGAPEGSREMRRLLGLRPCEILGPYLHLCVEWCNVLYTIVTVKRIFCLSSHIVNKPRKTVFFSGLR